MNFPARGEVTATNPPPLAITLSFHVPGENFRAWNPEDNRSTNNPSWYVTTNACWSLCASVTLTNSGLVAIEAAFSLSSDERPIRWQRITDWFPAPLTNHLELAALPLATAYFRLRQQ